LLAGGHDGGRGREEGEDGGGLVDGSWGVADGFGSVREDIELAEGEAFEEGGVASVECGEVLLVSVEAVPVGCFVGEGGVSSPAGGVEVLLGWDEDGGCEEGEAGEEEEESGVEVSEERA